MSLFWYAGVHRRGRPAGHGARIRPLLGGAPARLPGAALLASASAGRCSSATAGADRTEYVAGGDPARRLRASCSTSAKVRSTAAELPRAFNRRPHWQRILVLLAGPAVNFLFAILVLLGPVLGEWRQRGCARWSATSPRLGRGARGLAQWRRDPARSTARRWTAMRDVVLDLLDAMSARGEADLSVSAAGAAAAQRAPRGCRPRRAPPR